ncbi:hypothetical protein Hypma_007307 [Hypsizygus marmoreus]|uniref:Uncharacterized protein n=1 Tax=Hypsizygus marmoreus TaxID=39966 RepID=A0A369KEP1_HYPMA|nr:hypothetical protein Hypma_007307 [Hypsizygus marmoreus]
MDSFSEIAAYLSIDTAPPSNEENGGSGNTTYCVVFAKEDVPANEENECTLRHSQYHFASVLTMPLEERSYLPHSLGA